MPLSEHPSSVILLLAGTIVALTTACKEEVKEKVDSFRFSFGLEYSVIKDGAYCAIEQSDVWTDSQVEPPADFEEAPFVILISENESDSIITQVLQVDWDDYKNLTDSDFEVTAPGLQHRERLLVKIGDETKVDWIRDFSKLKPQLRAPLEKLEHEIAVLASERRKNPLLPETLQLSLSMTAGLGTTRWTLTRSRGEAYLDGGGGAKELPPERFSRLWSRVIELRLLGIEYAPLETTEVSGREDSLSIRVNGSELVNYGLTTPYEGDLRVNEMRDYLATYVAE